MIKLQIIGHLGKDAEVKQISNRNVIQFSVAHSESWKDNQGVKQSRTTWVNCSYWTEKTGIAPYLKKGTQVYVEGQPEAQEWTGNDGKMNASLVCRVAKIELLGGQQQQSQQQQTSQPVSQPLENNIDNGDDLPF